MFRRKRDFREEMIEQLLKQNADLMDRLQELVGQVHNYQVRVYAQQSKTADFAISGEDASWESEDEADIRDMYEDGYIDAEAMKAALREIGYDNTEISF